MFELQPHQERAVAKMHNGSLLFAEPGTGKTHTAIGYYLAKEAPKDIYVITTAKNRNDLNWEHVALSAGITDDPKTTLGSVIRVDSWNNISKYQGVIGAFFIFDEQRLVGSGAWTKAFLKISKQNHWILLSGTPGDTWLDYIPVFIANGFVRNRTEFKQDYVIYAPWSKFPKVTGYRQVGKLVRWRNSITVHMPYERHTVRLSEEVRVTYDEVLLRRVVKDRWHVYENRPLRDVSELFAVTKRVVYTDASRLQAVRTLLKRHPKLIVFYQYDYELEELRKLAESSSDGSESCAEELENHYLKESRSSSKLPEDGQREPWTLAEDTTVIGAALAVAASTRSTETKLISSALDVALDLDPTTSWEYHTTKDQTTKSSTLDPENPLSTRRYTESSTSDDLTENPWDYLLSPEGLEENNFHLKQIRLYTTGASETSLAQPQMNGSDNVSNGKKKDSDTSPSKTGETTDPKVLPAFEVAEWNGHKHQPIPRTDSWVYLVQYVAGSEAWNCIETDAMCFWSRTYSYKIWHQAHGRIDRMNTSFSELHYYELDSGSHIEAAVKGSLRAKKSFNEVDYVRHLRFDT